MGLTKKKMAQLPKPANVNNSSKVETAPAKKQEVKLPGLLSNYEVVAQDPLKQILSFTKRKMLSLETRKDKLAKIKDQVDNGETLADAKLQALTKYEEVLGSAGLAKEFFNIFTLVHNEVSKIKERVRNEELQKKEQDKIAKASFMSKAHAILKLLTSSTQIQQDFLEANNNAVKLEQSELDVLLNFCTHHLYFIHNPGDDVLEKAENSALQLNHLYVGSDAEVSGSTYAKIKKIFDKICGCKYFHCLPEFAQVESSDSEESLNEKEAEETPGSIGEDQDKIEKETAAKPGMESLPSQDLSKLVDSTDLPKPETDAAASPIKDYSDLPTPKQAADTPSVPSSLTSNELQPAIGNVVNTSVSSASAMDELQAVIGNIQLSFMSFQVDEQPTVNSVKEEKPARAVHSIEEVLAGVQGEYDFLQESMIDLEKPERITNTSDELHSSAAIPTVKSQSVDPTATNQFNISSATETYLQNGPNTISNDVQRNLHHAHNQFYHAEEKTDPTYAESKLMQNPENQIKQAAADNLGMSQTTFGSKEAAFNVEITSNQYNAGAMRSVEGYRQQSSEMPMIKPLAENTFSTSPFGSLHGSSQSPFEGVLAGNKIPDPIPLPNNAALSQTLAPADPPTTHIPFPNDKMSGYRSYTGTAPSIDNANIGKAAENPADFSNMQDKQHQPSLLSAGDAVHIPAPVLKLDANPAEDVTKEAVIKDVEKHNLASSSARSVDDKTVSQPASGVNRNNRTPASYQNAPSNHRGSSGGQNFTGGGFYANRSSNYRPSHNRSSYGNFDSMGHPKNFSGPGGNYQQGGSGGMAPFNSHYNRQDNGMYGGMQRRGAGGSGRGYRGYPPRTANVRNGGANNNYNRSRTFRPQGSDQIA